MIRTRDVRVVDVDGKSRVVPTSVARSMAEERGLDLVEVAGTADPPVCRIMDYGKFRYLERKKESESKKKQTKVQMKEVKLRSRTDDHDVDFKVKNIKRFLEEGNRVKVSVFFRGREITHPEQGKKMLDYVFTKLDGSASMESGPRLEGRFMSMMLLPTGR